MTSARPPSRRRSRPEPPAKAATLRRAAEQHLVQLHLQTSPARLETDEHRLLHELQVHKVELEMQNAELQDARERTESLLEKYTDLYDFAPVGYFSLNPQGRILMVNLTGTQLLGIERARLIGQTLGGRLVAADRSVLKAFLLRVFSSEAPQWCEVTLAGPAGHAPTVILEAQRLAHTPECRTVMRDITYRRQTEDKIRVSETRYRRLFEAAHDGVLLLDPVTRKITDANPFMTKLLGYPYDQLVGKELFEIGLLQDEAASQTMFRKLQRKHEVRYEDLPLESSDGRHQEVEVVANLYSENGRAVIQCNIRDITARKHAQDALRRSEAQYRTLFNLSPMGVYAVDATGRIRAFNRHAVTLWGRRPRLTDKSERFCGAYKLFHPGGQPLPHHQCPMADVLHGRLPEARDAEVIVGRADGSRITCVVNIQPLYDAQGKIMGAINCFYDITERKKAEAAQLRLTVLATANREANREIARRREIEASLRQSESVQRGLLAEARDLHLQLRHLTRDLLTAQEDERKKISRELHDDVMQTLVGINVALSALTKRTAADPVSLKSNIARTQQLVKNSLNAVHRFARELRPAVLDDFGLLPALQAYGKGLAARKKFRIRLTATGDLDSLDSLQRTTLFRVAQESLSNVARHAEATVAKVRLTRIAGAVCLEVQDDGKSFQVRSTLAPGKNKRLGLLGMRERVEMIGGTLAIESAPGRGTLVRAEIPLRPGGGP